MKFALVLRIETCVVEVPRAKALVKSVHMMPLKTRLRRKKMPLIRVSKRTAPEVRWMRRAREEAIVEVSSVVVLRLC
jgi:hypothetical protein